MRPRIEFVSRQGDFAVVIVRLGAHKGRVAGALPTMPTAVSISLAETIDPPPPVFLPMAGRGNR
jgi:hypothetical protein